jgi:positive regulator of sigma E activity
MATADDEARRRRLGILLIVAVLLLFVGQMVALAIGSLEVAAIIFIVFIIGWFVLRSYIRGRQRAEP